MEHTGLNPVAKLTEHAGDLYQHAEWLSEGLDASEYVLVSVIHGDIYLCTPKDINDDPYWSVIGEVSEGEIGAWDSSIDQASKQLPDGAEVINVLNDTEDCWYTVEVPSDQ